MYASHFSQHANSPFFAIVGGCSVLNNHTAFKPTLAYLGAVLAPHFWQPQNRYFKSL